MAGAFHTVHMEPAVAHLAGLARAISTHDPRTRLLSNADGQVVHDGREVLRRLVGQVASPVRWDLCMATMADLGVTGLLEMPPAGTLTGIAKRNLKGVELFALNTPDQLEDALDFVHRHGRVASATPIAGNPTWRLVVSPGKGQFTRTEDVETDTVLPSHSTVGTVTNRGTRSRSAHRTAASWSSGWSRTATRSPPASRCCACTRPSSPLTPRRSADERRPATCPPGARPAAILGFGGYRPAPGGRQRRDLHL